MRVAEEGRGEPESAVHAEREGAEPLVPEAVEADDVEHLLGADGRDPGDRAHEAELAPDRTGGVARHVAEQGADLAGRVGHLVEGAAPEVGDAPARFELQHQAQGRGLAGAGDAEQGGDPARPGLEGQVVHLGRTVAAGCAGESNGLEHRFSPGSGTTRRHGGRTGTAGMTGTTSTGVT